jgi:outer membrane lipoprotein-sorting protein
MKRALLLSLLVVLFSFDAHALDADKIVEKSESKTRGISTQALMTMVVKRPSYTRTLKLRSWSVGKEKALVEILEPVKETGVSSLRVQMEMWNYLPKTDQVIRIPPSLMLQSWMGSDFTNDDLMKSSSISRDYRHRLVKKEILNGQKSLLIECLPKKDAAVVWGKIQFWVRESDYLPVKQKFFDDQNKWVRTIDFSQYKKMDDRTIPSKMQVTVAGASKEATIVTYQKILYDRKLPNSLFQREEVRQSSQRGKILAAGWFFTGKRR